MISASSTNNNLQRVLPHSHNHRNVVDRERKVRAPSVVVCFIMLSALSTTTAFLFQHQQKRTLLLAQRTTNNFFLSSKFTKHSCQSTSSSSTTTTTPTTPTTPTRSTRTATTRLNGSVYGSHSRRVYKNVDDNYNDEDFEEEINCYKRPTIQWYPGHIAKAERQLKETLKVVDVLVEVRNAKAPLATSHPKVIEWCAGKPRIIVFTHLDTIPLPSMKAWKSYFSATATAVNDGTATSPVPTAAAGMEDLPKEVVNQVVQAQKERQKYTNDQSQQENNKLNDDIVVYVNARQGQGIHALTRTILQSGVHVKERRERRGLKQRALRVGILGYPNVGKSALINRLLGRKRARTANTPGVTRSLQWIRVRNEGATYTDATGSSGGATNNKKKPEKEFELLDSPGIIPSVLGDQSDAMLLAACNCIGDASYDNQLVAAYLFQWLKDLHLTQRQEEEEEVPNNTVRSNNKKKKKKKKKDNDDDDNSIGAILAPEWRPKCLQRYGFDPMVPVAVPVVGAAGAAAFYDDGEETKTLMTGEDMLHRVAQNTCQGNLEDASRKVLQDFRTGRLGPICLQLPPTTTTTTTETTSLGVDEAEHSRQQQPLHNNDNVQQLENEDNDGDEAIETARRLGIQLPPTFETQEEEEESAVSGESNSNDDKKNDSDAADIGKGLFDGW